LKSKNARYLCNVCGKTAVVRIDTSVWRCKHCGATYAGGAYSMNTTAGLVAARMINQTKN
jgi:large subunit ribosomal protein L37Ae